MNRKRMGFQGERAVLYLGNYARTRNLIMGHNDKTRIEATLEMVEGSEKPQMQSSR